MAAAEAPAAKRPRQRATGPPEKKRQRKATASSESSDDDRPADRAGPQAARPRRRPKRPPRSGRARRTLETAGKKRQRNVSAPDPIALARLPWPTCATLLHAPRPVTHAAAPDTTHFVHCSKTALSTSGRRRRAVVSSL